MIARVPVYGTTDAGRNLYCKEFGLQASQLLSDDFRWAATGPLVNRF